MFYLADICFLVTSTKKDSSLYQEIYCHRIQNEILTILITNYRPQKINYCQLEISAHSIKKVSFYHYWKIPSAINPNSLYRILIALPDFVNYSVRNENWL